MSDTKTSPQHKAIIDLLYNEQITDVVQCQYHGCDSGGDHTCNLGFTKWQMCQFHALEMGFCNECGYPAQVSFDYPYCPACA